MLFQLISKFEIFETKIFLTMVGFCKLYKVECIFTVFILPLFRMDQYRDDDHREDGPHFTFHMYHGILVEGLP